MLGGKRSLSGRINYRFKRYIMLLSLVVPCYNEEENVEKFFAETNNAFSGKGFEYEFVFVNDGSRDLTHKKLKKLYEENENYTIQVLTFSRNFGKEAAIYAGLGAAKGDMVCIIDADLQQRPEVVLEMLEAMNEDGDTDCVAAYQEKRKEGIIMRASKAAFYKLINRISEVEFVSGASDFRLMKRDMVNAVLEMTEYHRFSKGIFSWVGFNTKYIPYKVEKRESGKSKWNFRKLMKYALDGIISFSSFPLRLSSFVGIISAVISIIYLVILIVKKLAFSIAVPAYAAIVVLVLFLGGLQLFCFGFLGEYLSKIYVQVKNRPVYILKEHLGKNDEKVD